MRKVSVSTYRRSGDREFYAQWVDPLTRKTRAFKMHGYTSKKKADKDCVSFVEQIMANESGRRGDKQWDDFVERYVREKVSTLAPSSQAEIQCTLNRIKEIINPLSVGAIDSEAIGLFSFSLRKREYNGKLLSPATIKKQLVNLHGILNWAFRQQIIGKVPYIEKPKVPAEMKGRPVTGEEFDRMIDKVVSVTGIDAAPSWEFLLRGLYWSGLRLEEAVELHWANDEKIMIDFSCDHPMFRIRPEGEKGKKSRLCPIAPEFCEMIESVPKKLRRSYFFDPIPLRMPSTVRLNSDWIGKVIMKIGKAAQVQVSNKRGNAKFASAHDLRRSFAERWSRKVEAKDLQEIMRHESIITTNRYYVGRNAEATASRMWDHFTEETTEATEITSFPKGLEIRNSPKK